MDAITITFHNLCAHAVGYAVVADDEEPNDRDARVIAAGASIEITKAKRDKIVRRNEDGSWGGSASTQTEGGHIAVLSSCDGMAAADDPRTDPKALDRLGREPVEAMKKPPR